MGYQCLIWTSKFDILMGKSMREDGLQVDEKVEASIITLMMSSMMVNGVMISEKDTES